MATPAHRLQTLRKNFGLYAERRGGTAPEPLASAAVARAVSDGYSLMRCPLREGVQAGAIVEGTRMFARPVTAVFIQNASIDSEMLQSLMTEALGGDRCDIVIVGVPLALKAVLAKKAAVFEAAKHIRVRYHHFARFIVDVQRHAHTRSIRHYLPDREEIETELRYKFTTPAELSRLSAWDPQCIWLGARGGDVVGVHEFANNTVQRNYFQVVEARLGERGLKH